MAFRHRARTFGQRPLLATASAAGLLEAWGSRSRATRTERRKPLPGDELVPHPKWQATRAITIHTPTDQIWPWIVQMGFPTHRAGWYTPFWLDRLLFGINAHSATTIVPELQHLAIGDRVPDSDSGVSFFTVARIEPSRALVLLSTTHPLPAYTDVNFAWAFILEDAGSKTRLIMRARVDYAPVWPSAVVRLLMLVGFGIGDFVQAGAMLDGIKRRAERYPSARHEPPVDPGSAAVDLYWIPLGAGGHWVRLTGRAFEALAAALRHRARVDLYHAALIVQVDSQRYTIELAPSPNANEGSRGVVATGPVGSRLIGCLRLFRYEVRRWPDGSIPDLHHAVGEPQRLTTDPHTARQLLDAIPNVPTPLWGRDELKVGEMWNSNSVISWALATTGLATDQLLPPPHGRAPGWNAGLDVARRNPQRPQPPGSNEPVPPQPASTRRWISTGLASKPRDGTCFTAMGYMRHLVRHDNCGTPA
jgi:hypothetical protein